MKKIIYAVIAVLVVGTVVAFILGNEQLGTFGAILSGIFGIGGGAGVRKARIKAAGDKARAAEEERLATLDDDEVEAEIPGAKEAREERNRIADAAAKAAGEEAAAKRRRELEEQGDSELVDNLRPEVQSELDRIKKKRKWR